jgi:hypothetical protein
LQIDDLRAKPAPPLDRPRQCLEQLNGSFRIRAVSCRFYNGSRTMVSVHEAAEFLAVSVPTL